VNTSSSILISVLVLSFREWQVFCQKRRTLGRDGAAVAAVGTTAAGVAGVAAGSAGVAVAAGSAGVAASGVVPTSVEGLASPSVTSTLAAGVSTDVEVLVVSAAAGFVSALLVPDVFLAFLTSAILFVFLIVNN
jgi:hypothetical protein